MSNIDLDLSAGSTNTQVFTVHVVSYLIFLSYFPLFPKETFSKTLLHLILSVVLYEYLYTH